MDINVDSNSVYISLDQLIFIGFTLFVWYEFFATMSLFEIMIVLRVLTILIGGYLLFQLFPTVSILTIPDLKEDECDCIEEVKERVSKESVAKPTVTEETAEFADLIEPNTKEIHAP